MKAYSLLVYIICCIYRYTSIEIKPELKKNILKFGYGINYKYEEMLTHSYDRFYVVIILNAVKTTIRKMNPDYDRVIKRLHLYYDMKLVTFSIDKNKNLIIQFPVFIQPYTQQPLVLYQIETVPVPIIYQNTHADSYSHLQVDRPYIALNSETYITIRQQEPHTCKTIGYEFYCEELFVVKHKSKYSSESTIHFDLNPEIIKENCKFTFYYNNTDITPTVLDGGIEIILPNWPNNKHVICSIKNDIPVRIPSHLHVLVNRRVLCNCGIEAENNFL